jgi:hypothetical protein
MGRDHSDPFSFRKKEFALLQLKECTKFFSARYILNRHSLVSKLQVAYLIPTK